MLSRLLADSLGIDSALEDISPILEAAGCYRRRDDAIRKVCPDYGPGYKSKIVLPSVIDSDSFRLYSVVVMAPDGTQTRHRLTPESYLGIVAATNFKQRVRKMLEYYHADRLNYVVAGTPNRLEYDQGFFVKLGDGAADVKPIAHLYKSQVYALAEYLGVPEEIRSRPPTTDTYSLPQSQEEFYFSLPYDLHGPVPVRQEQRRARRGHRRRHRPDRRAGQPRLPRHRPEAQDNAVPAPRPGTRRRSPGDLTLARRWPAVSGARAAGT